jgi:DNA-binding protein H-NS
MAKTLAQLAAEIQKLQAEADKLRDKERGDVIDRIKEAIAVYGLTAADLGLGGRGRGRQVHDSTTVAKERRVAAGRKSPAVVKYRDDKGNTWSGHGRRPQWYLDAIASGKSGDDLLA